MRAIGYSTSLPIEDEHALEDIQRPDPDISGIGPRDLIVEVKAVSVNPVDTKVRRRAGPEGGETHKVLGYDASGIVRHVGSEVALFEPGDEVFYAGAIGRPGTNSELHVVDERIVGTKPRTLSHTEAAALPLTTITAWELLFDGMKVPPRPVDADASKGETLLVIGGAGGVGSILVQIAKTLTHLTVVATASRDETRDWCKAMGADHVIDHHGDMKAQLDALGLSPRYVASLTATGDNFETIADLIAPRGVIAMIDDPGQIDVSQLKTKALTLHWEFMFTRPAFETEDMIEQHRLLSRIGDLVDDGIIRTTYNHDGGSIDAANLRKAHALQESGKAIGKTVLTGFS
ncbi:zinc-binding alcohol dehydrogenase family protein [Fulvimarina endophytica]|uniref:Zinc-type alcohol dehydrogenase-like protein n=1 Tax=Fulvimarina endophytica TaxID=2293836 RepID=A0A371X0T0_9HYPH|nr:zinc-binding alcohol dehydrogenase family protein [Fulvimarina endophytica]RFC62815.1 zinc-binding alcohol dehydrogenase family protein [Fulvimarina endophytica]